MGKPYISKSYKAITNPHPDRRGKTVRLHVHVAECALGRRLPPGAQVHHVDGDKSNNAPSNLVICQDAAYHQLLHARQRVLRAGGNPNTQVICTHCRALFIKKVRLRRSRGRVYEAYRNQCAACAREKTNRHRAIHGRKPRGKTQAQSTLFKADGFA